MQRLVITVETEMCTMITHLGIILSVAMKNI